MLSGLAVFIAMLNTVQLISLVVRCKVLRHLICLNREKQNGANAQRDKNNNSVGNGPPFRRTMTKDIHPNQ
jgi:hypothetical protein